jgi:putative intracellular protease/amidase
LQTKESSQKKCVLVLIADGFKEREAIVLLSLLRQAGLCVKSVGLTSGLVSSAHGVWLMPDLTLTDLNGWTNATSISAVILPKSGQSLARLKTDPRVHKLLRETVVQGGQVVTSREGLRVLCAAALWGDALTQADSGPRMPVLLREPDHSPETLAQNLVRRLKQPPRK